MNYKRHVDVNESGWYYVCFPRSNTFIGNSQVNSEFTYIDYNITNGKKSYVAWLTCDDNSGQLFKEPVNLSELREGLFLGPVEVPDPSDELVDQIFDEEDIKKIII